MPNNSIPTYKDWLKPERPRADPLVRLAKRAALQRVRVYFKSGEGIKAYALINGPEGARKLSRIAAEPGITATLIKRGTGWYYLTHRATMLVGPFADLASCLTSATD